MNLILASKSPRRIELLKQIHPEFSVEPAKGEEIVPEGATAANIPMWTNDSSNELYILSRQHDTTSEICSVCGQNSHSHTWSDWQIKEIPGKGEPVTEVEFYPLSEEEILWYASLEEPYDKAGGYGIQGKGSLLVKGIHGDYFNVMGFPVALAARKMRKYFNFTDNK